jgi:precorrin-6A/cobalt-precorrin-6A reductase
VTRPTILIIGGTSEATALAAALGGRAMLSLAGRTRAPLLPDGPHRIGGFGGAAGLARFLKHDGFAVLVDATHPFAARISANALLAARAAGVALLAIRRPEWRPGAGDRWTEVADMAAAAAALGATPRRVFLTVGRQDLAPFAAAPWHHYLVRSVDPPDPAVLPPGAVAIAARGPFGIEEERRLLADHAIDLLVTKNSGAAATAAKLAAARALRLGVVMVARPALPEGAPDAAVADVPAALAWLRHHAALRGV